MLRHGDLLSGARVFLFGRIVDRQCTCPEMIHEPYRYRCRHSDGLFLGSGSQPRNR
ncbi:SWIM zinc finger family protein [Pseudomonas fluorescens]|uniref:SWIM zinc finger family protein n=1 Tax=Pseudomonas fluorescens TaxID=294 RepID=UPI003AF336F7